MNTINNNYSPNFTSKIKFVSPDKFIEICGKHFNDSSKFVDYPWNITTMRKSNDILGALNIDVSTGALVSGQNKDCFGVFEPKYENIENIDAIKFLYKKFMHENPIKSALLIGSRSKRILKDEYKEIYAQSALSRRESANALYRNIIIKGSSKIFDSLNEFLNQIEPSVFQGQKSRKTMTHVFRDIPNDTTYICTHLNHLDDNAYVKDENTLFKAFEKVKISKNDSLDFLV